MIHRIKLSNGRVILLEEGDNSLHIATEDDPKFPSEVGMYLCEIADSVVKVWGNSADHTGWLTAGLKKEAPAKIQSYRLIPTPQERPHE